MLILPMCVQQVSLSIHLYTYQSIYTPIYLSIYIYIYIYIYIHIYIFILIYEYIYIHEFPKVVGCNNLRWCGTPMVNDAHINPMMYDWTAVLIMCALCVYVSV